MPVPKCPLNDQDCERLTQLVKDCHDLSCFLDQLETLGLDVTALRAELNGHRDFASGAKAKFFPTRP